MGAGGPGRPEGEGLAGSPSFVMPCIPKLWGSEDVVCAQPWERGRPRPILDAPALRDRSDPLCPPRCHPQLRDAPYVMAWLSWCLLCVGGDWDAAAVKIDRLVQGQGIFR